MAVSMSSLPPELLIRICDFMQTKKEVASFHQCSQQFYAVATPFLYRHIDLLSASQFSHTNRTDDASHAIESLVQAFLRNPHLGQLVQHLAIRMPEVVKKRTLAPLVTEHEEIVKAILHNDYETQSQANPRREPASFKTTAAADSGSDWDSTDESADEDEVDVYTDPDPDDPLPVFETEADRWIYLAGRSPAIRGNVMLTILLSRLSNLERLDLEMPILGWRTGFLDRAIQRNQSVLNPSESSPFLANLHHVCFGYTSPRLRGESWVGPFVLPEVTKVYLHRLSGLGPTLGCLKPNTLNITHLELRDCRIPPPSLQRLLAGPKALKTFVYVIGEVQNRAEHHMPISYRSLRQALENQKDSLEELWLDYPHDYSWDDSSTRQTAPMGSLSAFTKLKHLRIAGTYVFGFVWTTEVDERRLVQALPEQLEMLQICHGDEDEETLEGITFILDAKRQGRFHKLKKLKLEAASDWYIKHRPEVVRMLELAKNVDLDIRLLDNHCDKRLEGHWARLQATMSSTQSVAYPRRESPWGFKAETTWPTRVSGCMQIPVYDDITQSWVENNG